MSHSFSFTELLLVSGDIAYDWDVRSDRIQWYGAEEKIFGTGAPLNSQSFYNAIYIDDRHIVFGREGQSLDREYRLMMPHGGYVWVHERGAAELDDGRIVRQRGMLRIVERVTTGDAHAQFEIQSRDVLTGCHSRPQTLAMLGKAMEAAQAARRLSAYLVIGIDKMSVFNEAVGMEAGDALLRGVAERLSQIIPSRAMLGRVGGDMFGIILPEPLGNDFSLLAENILENFRDHPIITSVTPLHITVSIGGVSLPTIAKNATEAMIFAEQALHDAHQHGRNLFVEYLDKPERAQEHRQLLDLSGRIKYAFKNKGFRLAYQPIIETATGDILFYEALVRMFGDDGAPISAAKFVPAIEQLGLAFELDCYVLDLAVQELEASPDLTLAINISGLTAVHAAWPDHLHATLRSRPHVARRMIIEITETAAIVDVTETRRFVDVLRALGGRVSLDDFGAGFTSIRHLRSLSLSIMKIDKELLHNVIDNSEQQHLVRMLIELARGLGLQTVAEGVETADVADWLRGEKVDMMQGYYFGKPLLERSWATNKKETAPLAGPMHHVPANRKSNVVVLPSIISPLSSSSAATMVPVAHDLAMDAIVFV